MNKIEYPITVNKISYSKEKTYSPTGWRKDSIGKFVAIRSVHEEDGNDTHLGLYLGEFAVSLGVTYSPEEKELEVTRGMYNPAIFVFDLNKVLFGYESWWGVIDSEEKLRKITNQDIENVWYVKALKQLQELDEKKEDSSEQTGPDKG
jgi:L-rhamnose mutarotase